jgi:hypothetical protein
MSSLLSSLSGLSGTIVPTLFKILEENEPQIESKIVEKLKAIKISNPTEYDMFLVNWRKLNRAIEASSIESVPTPPVAPSMTGGEESTGPMPAPVPEPSPPVVESTTPTIPQPSPPIIEPTGPTGPSIPEATGPSFMQDTGASGPTVVQRITEYFSPETGPTGPTGGKKNRKRKTAKQHRKRTHRVKHKKH